jgi:hypothetical protein
MKFGDVVTFAKEYDDDPLFFVVVPDADGEAPHYMKAIVISTANDHIWPMFPNDQDCWKHQHSNSRLVEER